MAGEAQGKLLTPPSFSGPGPADAAALSEAARLINRAECPVVLLGLLASKPANAEAVRDFIARGHLPVVGTFQSAGAVGAHLLDNFGGRVGQLANQPGDGLLEAADLVITVGYDPVEYDPSIWNRSSKRTIIHVDVLPTDLDTCYCPNVELTGDIALSLSALTPQISRLDRSPLSESILKTIAIERAHFNQGAARRNGAPIHPLRIVFELQKLLTPDVTVCLDMGSFHLWLARCRRSVENRPVVVDSKPATDLVS